MTTSPALPTNFMTVQEVADLFRVSRMTIYRLIERGDIECYRIGRGFRIPAVAAREFLKHSLIGPD